MAKKAKSGKLAKAVDRVSQKSDNPGIDFKPAADLRIYQEAPGHVPLLDFIAGIPDDDKADMIAMVEMLRDQGHRLRPPYNEHLVEQIYYLRISAEGGTYRVFYWPFGKGVVILGHGFSKKTRKCPPGEVKRAKRMRDRFAADPDGHTYRGEINADEKA